MMPKYWIGSRRRHGIMIERQILAAMRQRPQVPCLANPRYFITSPRPQASAATGPSSSGTIPPNLLQRQTPYSRPLPSLALLSSSRRWLRTLPIFFAILTGSALAIFNYQKANSPVITATMYSLRTNDRVRSVLGDEVYFGSRWALIWGEINLVQGRIDVRFSVKGSKQRGLCRFRARRVGGKGGTVSAFEKGEACELRALLTHTHTVQDAGMELDAGRRRNNAIA